MHITFGERRETEIRRYIKSQSGIWLGKRLMTVATLLPFALMPNLTGSKHSLCRTAVLRLPERGNDPSEATLAELEAMEQQ